VSRTILTTERAVPTVTGVRHVFDEAVVSGLSPARLARIMRDAAEGDLLDFLTLAEEMEEREPHYRFALETRKNAVTSLDAQIDPASEDTRDIEIADFCREHILRNPGFQTLPDMLIDGLAKGFSVVEVVWATQGHWLPVSYIWRDPRLFQVDRDSRAEIRLRMQGSSEGTALEPFKYLLHRPLLKMGLPGRNGLARVAAWGFLLKSYSLRDWAQFLEVYGMPLRLGKYGPGASADDKAVLLSAVRNLGSDAAAIVPQAMEIELIEAKGFSDKPFEAFASYIDQQIAMLITGKRSETGSSKAAEETHDKVRLDIKKADARDLALTLNAQLVRPLVDLNFGVQKSYPWLSYPVPERRDLQVWSNAVAQLTDRGLEIEQAQLYGPLGLTEPAKEAKLLKASGGSAPPAPPVERPSTLRLDPRSCPGCGSLARLAAEEIGPGPGQDEEDRLVAEELARFEDVMDPVRRMIDDEFRAATSYDDLDQRLAGLAGRLPMETLARRIAILNLKGLGRGLLADGG
jgi:phage gp29-like protein